MTRRLLVFGSLVCLGLTLSGGVIFARGRRPAAADSRAAGSAAGMRGGGYRGGYGGMSSFTRSPSFSSPADATARA